MLVEENTIQSHVTLCQEIYDLLLHENSILKMPQVDQTAINTICETKKSLLPRLDASLAALHQMDNAKAKQSPVAQASLKDGQAILMKIFYLSKENERELLKIGQPKEAIHQPTKVTMDRLRATYGASSEN